MTCKIPTLVRKFAAEFLGTMILVVFGCGAALLFSPTFPLTTLTVALAFGLVIIAMAAAIGDISGCHINPAVSLAMLLDGRMGIGEFLTYLAAQFLGGIAGGGVLALISNGNVQSGLGSNGYLESASSHIRNLIAHEPDCSEESLCVPSDSVWIENFCTRILNLSDPLSLYRRALKEQRKAQVKRIPQPQDLDFENAVRTNENFNKSSANKNNGNKAAKHAAAACFAAVFTVAAILILMLILFLFLLTAE